MKKALLSSLVALLSISAFADAPKTEAVADNNPAPVSTAEINAGGSPVSEEKKETECKVVLEANDQMQFDKKEFSIKKDECAEFTVELDNVGQLKPPAMGHNVVLTKTADLQAAATDGMAAAQTNYVKEGDERVIAHTKLIGGGEKDAVTFKTDKLEKGGDYSFFCSFPGHFAVMQGKVMVE